MEFSQLRNCVTLLAHKHLFGIITLQEAFDFNFKLISISVANRKKKISLVFKSYKLVTHSTVSKKEDPQEVER